MKATTWIRVLVILLMAGLLGLYVYDLVVNHTPVTENLFKLLAVECLLISTLIRLRGKVTARGLDFYEKRYENELGTAFKDKPLWRKKLLCAVRLFNQNNYRKALKYLNDLARRCETTYDARAVLLFAALCYSDAGLREHAIRTYYTLLEHDASNATVHNNLGLLFAEEGDYEMAMKHCDKAIELKPQYYHPYLNKANFHFRRHEMEEAIACAEKVLEINPNVDGASGLLALIYALQGDREKQEKYAHLAAAAGCNPKKIQDAIDFYLAAKAEEEAAEAEVEEVEEE
ncbi:MAG: tetratricopeptide repeat protein [Clostridia bacterium]|nr:tetratricopeptide repeat protein [Clostridia bacterium]